MRRYFIKLNDPASLGDPLVINRADMQRALRQWESQLSSVATTGKSELTLI
jgi:hypothetical protein